MPYDPEEYALLTPRTITLPAGKWDEIQDLLYGYGNDEVRMGERMQDQNPERSERIKAMGRRTHALADLLTAPPAAPPAAPEEDG